MTTYKSSFLKVLQERGYLHQLSDETALDEQADDGIVTGYIGFDCTASSLHVGNLIGIMMLRKLQHDQAAAQKAGKDQQNNAVAMSRKELHDYCGVTETTKEKAASSGSPGSLFDGEGIIREFVPLQSKEFVYVPAKKQKELEDKATFKNNWKKGAVKDAVQMRADSRTAKANEPKTSAMKKKHPLEFKIESDWKAEGSGSLLDMMDTGDPRNCWWLFANPITLPVAMLDYVGEKFPGFFRKNHGGQWDWAKKSKYFDGGYEARFAR